MAALGAPKSKRGWLRKFMHGAFSSSWKAKYMVLGDGHLAWYGSDKEGTKAERSFSIGLVRFAAAMESLGELPFVFEIVVGADKSYYFQAKDEQELFEWLSALSRPKAPGLRKRRSVSFDASSDNQDEITPRQEGGGVLAPAPYNPLEGAPVISPRRSSPRERQQESPGRGRDREAEMAARIEAELRDRFEAEVARRVEVEMKRLSVAVFAKIEHEARKDKKHKHKHKHKHRKEKKAKKEKAGKDEDPAARTRRKEARRQRREAEAAAAMLAAGAALDEAAREKEKDRMKPLALPRNAATDMPNSSVSAAPQSGPSRISMHASQAAPQHHGSQPQLGPSNSTRRTTASTRRSSVRGAVLGGDSTAAGHGHTSASSMQMIKLGEKPQRGGNPPSRSLSHDAHMSAQQASGGAPGSAREQASLTRSTSVDPSLQRPASARTHSDNMRRSASDNAMREKTSVQRSTQASGGAVGSGSGLESPKRTGLLAQASRVLLKWENFLRI